MKKLTLTPRERRVYEVVQAAARKESRLYEAVQAAAAVGVTPQRIAAVIRDAMEETGSVPGGLWLMWLDKAAATSGEAKA